MSGFVAVGILANHAANIWADIVAGHLAGHHKERIELVEHFLAPTKERSESFRVLRHEPSPLPRGALRIVVHAVRTAHGVERRAPVSL